MSMFKKKILACQSTTVIVPPFYRLSVLLITACASKPFAYITKNTRTLTSIIILLLTSRNPC